MVPYHMFGAKTGRLFILAFKISCIKFIISPHSSKFDNIGCGDSDQLVYDIGLVNTVHNSISDLVLSICHHISFVFKYIALLVCNLKTSSGR